MTKFTYYEIWNTLTERTADCTERCATLEDAKRRLKNCCDWCRPCGTGRIYKINLITQDDGTVTRTMNMEYEVI